LSELLLTLLTVVALQNVLMDHTRHTFNKLRSLAKIRDSAVT